MLLYSRSIWQSTPYTNYIYEYTNHKIRLERVEVLFLFGGFEGVSGCPRSHRRNRSKPALHTFCCCCRNKGRGTKWSSKPCAREFLPSKDPKSKARRCPVCYTTPSPMVGLIYLFAAYKIRVNFFLCIATSSSGLYIKKECIHYGWFTLYILYYIVYGLRRYCI